jgi:penicillin-binding protein 1A
MDKNSRFKKPSGLVSAKVVVGSNPPEKPNSTTPSSKIQTHLFVKGTEPKKVSTTVFGSTKSDTTTTDSKETISVQVIPGD